MDINYTKTTRRDVYRRQLERELAELIDPETGLVSLAVAEYVPCPLCGAADRHREIFSVKGYPHVRCLECGLVYTNPQVNEEKLHALYGSSLANDLWLDVLTSAVESGARYALYDRYFTWLETLTPHRSLVDVGCSIGDLLLAARRRGWEAVGCDLARKAVDFASRERGLDARLGRLEDLGFADGSLPVITLTGVLEHLNRPVDTLRMVRRLLTDDGTVLVQVPNLHSLHNLILHEKSTSFDGRNHLVFFTSDTLTRTLAAAGFEPLRLGTVQGVTHVLGRYLQFEDPYEGEVGFDHLPASLRGLLQDEKSHQSLIGRLEDMGLGRSILAIARKR